MVPKGDHDARKKIVLGHEVDSGQDVILQLLLKEERVATYIAGKFWREFVAEQADDVAIRALATAFFRAKYDIRTLLRATLLCEPFWNPANRGTLVKSPVEFLVGIARTLQLSVVDGQRMMGGGSRFTDAGKLLGQDIFEPPNVKGWRGGNSWLNCETMLQRWRTVDSMVEDAQRSVEPATKRPKAKPVFAKPSAGLLLVATPWLDEAREQGAAGIERVIDILLPLPPSDPIPRDAFVPALRAVLHDSTFHLK